MSQPSKLKLAVYLIGLFLVGVLTGGIITVQIAHHFRPSQKSMAARWSAELHTQLNLSPSQVQAIDPIIKNTLQACRTNFANFAMSALTNGNAQIATNLTAEQKEKFKSIAKGHEDFVSRALGSTPQRTNQ